MGPLEPFSKGVFSRVAIHSVSNSGNTLLFDLGRPLLSTNRSVWLVFSLFPNDGNSVCLESLTPGNWNSRRYHECAKFRFAMFIFLGEEISGTGRVDGSSWMSH